MFARAIKKIRQLFFVLIPIGFTISGELTLKASINLLPQPLVLSEFYRLAFIPGVWLGIGLIMIAGILWLIAMSRFELSFLYPFLSTDYIVVIIASQIFLNESVSLQRYVAAGFIILGLLVISKSRHSEHKQ
jgi:drug/metabolite transporter (DMT)-like permease